MKIDEKRKVIEVLLCSRTGYGVLYTADDVCESWEASAISEIALQHRISVRDEWKQITETDHPYAQTATEAAYRLIESSPALRREWFGAP